MPNQYKNKVIYGDSVLMDITDTTAEAGDVANGAVFYAKNGARTVGTFTQAQSDWIEDDTTDPAFILNKPPIIAGEGEESIVSGKLDPNATTIYTLTITGDANSDVFTYTTEDTLPSSTSLRIFGMAHYLNSTKDVYKTIIKLDATNHLITLSGPIDVSAITNGTLTIYYKQHHAFGKYSQAEGQYTYTTGDGAHAEGGGSKALGQNSHAEGYSSVATGYYAHAEGNSSLAKGISAHAEGGSNTAIGRYSHVEGYDNVAASDYQHVHGKYNTEDSNMTYVDIVGNGTSSARSNAYTLDWSGNGWFAGKVSAGTVDTPASVTDTNDLTTKQYVDNAILEKQGKAVYGSTKSNDKNYISPYMASLYILDDPFYRNLIMSHNANVYGQLFFNSWNVAASANLIVSNTILYNNGLLCATLVGDIASNTWTFTVYPIQGALTFDSTPTNDSTNPITSGGVYTALSSKANSADIPSASSTAPLADGTAAVGTSTAYARADHVHPVSSIAALSDTNISSPSVGQALVYDGTSSKWVNTSVSASDIGAIPAPQEPSVGQFLTYQQLSQGVYGWGVTDLNAELNNTSAIFYELEPTDVENQFMIRATFSEMLQIFSSARKAYFTFTDSSTGDVIVLVATEVNAVSYTVTLVSISTYNIAHINLQVDSSTGYMKGLLLTTYLPEQLLELLDVNLNNPSDGQILTYNETSSKWINSTLTLPSASSTAPLSDGTAAVGTSTAYARADHVHPKIPIDSALSTTSENPVQNKVIQSALLNKLDVNANYNPIPLEFPDPENPPSILDGATVTCGMGFAHILELYQLAIDTTFEMPLDIQNCNFIAFHPFRMDETSESIELFSIFDNTIYTITLEPNTVSGMPHGMIGTLHVKDSVTIDSALSSSSTNPVTNSAITTAIANSKGKIFYGQVDSTSTSTAFTAQIPGIAAYEEGLVVILKNGVVTSASGFTININGLGALPVYNNLGAESRETTIFNVAYTMMFVYENRVSGGDWLCYRGYDANTNTIGYQLRTNSMSLPMKSVTYRYRLLFTSADGAHFVPANNTTSTNATASRAVCQDKIDPFGPIYYYGTTASVAANSRPSAVNLWQQYTIALGYSFNRTGAALTLTPWAPVYVKCAPQADGSAIIDSTTPYVQVLPTTADGKIYIFLGVAYSATNIELVPYHPVYCYRNGEIQIWTGTQGAFIPNFTPSDNGKILSIDNNGDVVATVAPSIPSASSSTPLVDGTAAVGTSTTYARADHVHPKITQTISMSNNVITLTGSDGSTSSVTLPVYDGTVTSGGGS